MEDKIVSSGSIGTVGGRNKRGKKEPNQTKLEGEMRREEARKARQNVEPAQEKFPVPEVYVGSQIIKHWVISHPELLGKIAKQIRDDCWALALSEILLFNLNKDIPTNQHHELDVERFIGEVKLSIEDLKRNKRLDYMDLAVGSLKKAMNHLYSRGMGKKDGKKGPKARALKSEFRDTENATADFIAEKLETKGPVGIIVDIDLGFRFLKDGILLLRKYPRETNMPRHALLIVAYGRKDDGELFFVLKNTWGTGWGVNGYGRVVIRGTCNIFFLEKILNN